MPNSATLTKKGFTLIEIMVVIAIIALLSSVVFSALAGARAKSRDARRLADIKQMQTALDMYFDEFHQYPSSDNAGCGGWDTPGNGTFITALVSNNLLGQHIKDPLPSLDGACANYRYYRYPAGYAGCPTNRGAFYVIEIIKLESISGTVAPNSPGWSCSGRNWQTEGNWVTGKYEGG